MIRLGSKNLPEKIQAELHALQKAVDEKATFSEQVEEAIRLWKNGSDTNTRKEVRTVLETMCVSTRICNYCEQDRANDIEHIAPKSFYPQITFVWGNYILACKQCNSGYKLDKCFVVDERGNLFEMERGIQPAPNTKVALINPRIEDPHDFMIVNMFTFKFDIDEDLSVLEKHKAAKTIDILKLNDDERLVEGRKIAANFFYNSIERLTRVLAANSNQELEAILTPDDDAVDETKSLQQNKDTITANFKKDIQTHKHPSVWYAIKMVQSQVNDKWKALFSKIPQALNW